MQKFNLKVSRKNGDEITVAVYLDEITAKLLQQTGDQKIIDTYLYEEYKTSRKARREVYWNRSLDEDLENGIDYEDRRFYGDYSFDDFEDEKLQAAIEQLTPRQQEILRLMYIEGKNQKDIAEIFGIDKRSISDAIKRIYASIRRNY
ncbi:MAG: sigma-70 family RNA polymerase sigma factor [Clostridiales bacterium]|nr:sigma-70 family RNA polymerase sigma factor [Clostridiales bacterium]